MRKPLTKRQESIFAFVRGYIERYRTSPTVSEVAQEFGIYRNAAQQHIDVLVKKGWLGRRRAHGSSGHLGSFARGLWVIPDEGRRGKRGPIWDRWTPSEPQPGVEE